MGPAWIGGTVFNPVVGPTEDGGVRGLFVVELAVMAAAGAGGLVLVVVGLTVGAVGAGGMGLVTVGATGVGATGLVVVGPTAFGCVGLAVVEPSVAGGVGLVVVSAAADGVIGLPGPTGTGGTGLAAGGDGRGIVVVGTAGVGGVALVMTGTVMVGPEGVGRVGLVVVGTAGAACGGRDDCLGLVVGTAAAATGGGADSTGLVAVGPGFATSPLQVPGDCRPPETGSGPEVIRRNGRNVGPILRALNTFSHMPNGLS